MPDIEFIDVTASVYLSDFLGCAKNPLYIQNNELHEIIQFIHLEGAFHGIF